MSVETIMLEEFKGYIETIHPGSYAITNDGGEMCFTLELDDKVGIYVRSSILPTGVSARAGENSIRVYPIRLGTGALALGSKVDRWIQRTSGWRSHLRESVETFTLWRERSGDCPVCGRAKEMRRVKKEGPNKDRPFAACFDHYRDSFLFLDVENARTEIRKPAPACQAVTNVAVAYPESESKPLGAVTAGTVNCEPPTRSADLSLLFEALESGKPISNDAPTIQDSDSEPAQVPTVTFSVPPVIPPSFRILPSDITPSQYQKDFYYMCAQGDKNTVLIAVAGSGKTKTEIEGLHYFDPSLSVGMAAFNRAIAAAAQKKAPSNVKVGTFHSLALGAVMKKMPHLKLAVGGDDDAAQDKMEIVYNMVTQGANRAQKYLVLRLVALLKNMLMEPSQASFDWLTDRYSMDIPETAKDLIYSIAERTYRKSIELNSSLVDFNDLIWLIATDAVSVRPFDRFLVDEAQDMDPAQIQMALRMGKVIYAVGDPNQSIYAFRGADSEAMPKLIAALDAAVLPLSICYRCPQSSIRLAQKYVPQIQWREDAPEGVLEEIRMERFEPQPGDLNISRVNSALIKPCLALIRRGIKAAIVGRDIGKGLRGFLERGQKMSGTDNLSIILQTLNLYTEAEVSKLAAANKLARAEFVQEQFDCLVAISDGCTGLSDVQNKIAITFSDQVTPIRFSSVHRAKGLEADRVHILKPQLLPMSRKNQQPWEEQQERNVTYVAYTRNKRTLYFVLD